ncbi:hydrogenase formation protein HypD [Vulcanimicrobium alpinum]|uniref:Hydrogenase formation protein HypD n=1 Tax=Vulcanimicrobium alpinum TaxID=3016050 RepID=A0AAN2C9G2_UNVUL|nr:hydrogenase formation protein HypD [Vulcanimicrobium alpinum]BDE06510.1 hydrogenase formation protein HypD [Vulcanimicrobium alpinum]
MKYVDEFRDPQLIGGVAREIARSVDPHRHYRIMEVCGGHTRAIYRHGLRDVLPENIELVHGPGCPVCVLPTGRVDDGLAIAQRDDTILTCFGDMLRVPGTHGTPLELKARGADIRMVYSPLDALRIAQDNPAKHVCFFAIGFETTAPSTALTLLRARTLGVRNFSVFCNHVTIVPGMRAILDSPDMRIDGFVGPGHVATVIGCRPFEFVARDYGKPVVVAGFEPLDILEAILLIVRQLHAGEARVENQYRRIVLWEGNLAALRAMASAFELRPFFEWRGLGFISQSALKLAPAFADFDAEVRFRVPGVRVTDPKAAQCGEVLKGVLQPAHCKLFGTQCNPEHPVGALMVSSEGACAAYYRYVHRGEPVTA